MRTLKTLKNLLTYKTKKFTIMSGITGENIKIFKEYVNLQQKRNMDYNPE